MFLLAFFGFGAKAGMMPLHSWLPRAHPAAPSHASA
ncbi:NADH-Ubiquinone/plastoquinone (complex I), various chains family protein, partial [Escherichia coli MP021017.12]